MKLLDVFQLLASGATAVAVFLAWWQIRQSRKQALVQFEDRLSGQYRALAQRLPIEALLGEKLEDVKFHDALPHLYHYIDLTNEQIFLRRSGRVSESTWKNWSEGIRWNLTRPAFARAWKEIAERSPESFEGIRRFEASEFKDDPRAWGRSG
jgi:hypothetical protein